MAALAEQVLADMSLFCCLREWEPPLCPAVCKVFLSWLESSIAFWDQANSQAAGQSASTSGTQPRQTEPRQLLLAGLPAWLRLSWLCVWRGGWLASCLAVCLIPKSNGGFLSVDLTHWMLDNYWFWLSASWNPYCQHMTTIYTRIIDYIYIYIHTSSYNE